jgi:hypothetical protein
MKSTKQIDFEKLDGLDTKYINLNDKDILDQCNIIPIPKNKIGENIEILIHKNLLQQKILTYQFEQLIDIYREIIKPILTIYEPNEKLTEEDVNLMNNLDCYDHETIKHYSNINTLRLIKEYRDNNSTVTSDEIIMYSNYIKKLFTFTCPQRIILNQQLYDLTTMFKNHVTSVLAKQKCIRVGNKLNMQHVTDKKIIADVQLLSNIQENLKQPIYKFNPNGKPKKYDRQSVPNKELESLLHIQPPISNKQTVSSDCSVCFINIEQKIALVPCGHATTCEKCADNFCNKKCPICRKSFDTYIKVFD